MEIKILQTLPRKSNKFIEQIVYFIERKCSLVPKNIENLLITTNKQSKSSLLMISKYASILTKISSKGNHLFNARNNMEEYFKLFNSLQVTKNQKKNKCDCLRVSYEQMTTDRMQKSLECSNVENLEGIKEEFLTKYEETQIRTSNEIEVKNNLWKEILQTKKSLNLLKGDIGHLVSRNQSAILLQSKISKVKIVADDQLKRVSLAFAKDKDQIKIRGDMQRKFNKKLKNVSMFQNSTLTRFKKNYIDTMVKKRQIHDRLTYIEKVSASINETGDKEKLKNMTNKRSLEMYDNFLRLATLIAKMPQIEITYGNSAQEIQQFVSQISSYCQQSEQIQQGFLAKSMVRSRAQQTIIEPIDSQDLQMINSQSLNNFQQIIRRQYHRIIQEIEKKTSEHDLQVKKSEEIVVKLQVCNDQISKIQSSYTDEANSKYILTKQIRLEYSEKLKKFIQLLKTIFVLLQYIEKYINYSGKNSEFLLSKNKIKKQQTIKSSNTLSGQQNQTKTPSEKDHSSLKVPTRSKNLILSQKSLGSIHRNYISELHKVYYILLKEDDSDSKLDCIQNGLFDILQMDVQSWLNEIKEDIVNGKQKLKPILYRESEKSERPNIKKQQSSKLRDSILSQKKPQKIGIQTEEEEINQANEQHKYNFQNYNRHHTVHREDNFTRHFSYSSSNSSELNKFPRANGGHSMHKSSQKNSMGSSLKIVNVSKLKNSSTQPINKKAMRIKFLQDLDKDYYKMLKSTITMEKQNTRKNYQFLRTFKRAKYSSRDEILQEKRYECSFSMLFAGKKNTVQNSPPLQHKKSGFFNGINETNETRVSKLGDSRKVERSSKLIKSSTTTLNLNDKEARQWKQNIKKIKTKLDDKNQQAVKRNLSIQMKDIINLM